MLVWADPGDPGKEDAKKHVLVCRVIGSKDRGSRWAILSGITALECNAFDNINHSRIVSLHGSLTQSVVHRLATTGQGQITISV